jgi:hypothetical protein
MRTGSGVQKQKGVNLFGVQGLILREQQRTNDLLEQLLEAMSVPRTA